MAELGSYLEARELDLIICETCGTQFESTDKADLEFWWVDLWFAGKRIRSGFAYLWPIAFRHTMTSFYSFVYFANKPVPFLLLFKSDLSWWEAVRAFGRSALDFIEENSGRVWCQARTWPSTEKHLLCTCTTFFCYRSTCYHIRVRRWYMDLGLLCGPHWATRHRPERFGKGIREENQGNRDFSSAFLHYINELGSCAGHSCHDQHSGRWVVPG